MIRKSPAVPLVTASLMFFSHLAIADTFRLGVLPDTQKTIEEAPEVFLSQIDWIVANRNDPNNPIVYVATLGDMKDDNNCDVKNVVNPETGATMSEWEILDYGYDELDAQVPRVPYGVVPGNHDYDPISFACYPGDPNDDFNRRLPDYNNFFGPNRFSGAAFYGGSEVAGDNEDNYTLFSSHGIDFIAINLGYRGSAYLENANCAAPGSPKQLHDAASHVAGICDLVDGASADLHDTELHWADDLLNTFPNRLAIITAHYIMDGNRDRSSGNFRTPSFGPYAQQLFDYLGGHQNLFMMLGAHERGEAWIINPRTGMQPVHGLLSNYQDLDFPTGDTSLAASFQNLPQHPSHPDSFTPTARHGDLTFSGFMRTMTFDTETGLVDIQTLAPAMTVLAPGAATPPAGRDVTVVSARSTDAASNSNNPASLTLTDRTATNINGISFVGYVNLPPTASAVTITDNNGGSADVGDTLSGNYSYNDLDGDADNSSFRWLRNGLAIAGATGQTYTLAAADAGQQVSFEVTPAASAGPVGVPVESASLTVTNNAPPPPLVFNEGGNDLAGQSIGQLGLGMNVIQGRLGEWFTLDNADIFTVDLPTGLTISNIVIQSVMTDPINIIFGEIVVDNHLARVISPSGGVVKQVRLDRTSSVSLGGIPGSPAGRYAFELRDLDLDIFDGGGQFWTWRIFTVAN